MSFVKQIFRCIVCNNPYFDYQQAMCNPCKEIIEVSKATSPECKKRKTSSIKDNVKKLCIDLLEESDGDIFTSNNVNDDANDNANDNYNVNSNGNDNVKPASINNTDNEVVVNNNTENNYEYYDNNDDLDFYDYDEYNYNNDIDNENSKTADNNNDNGDNNNHSNDDNDDDDDEKCFICNQNLKGLSIDDKDNHMLECLDQYEFSQSNSKITTEHENINDDDVGLRNQTFFCVICDQNLSSKGLIFRCLHLKKCAKNVGISTKELLQMVSPNFDEFALEDDDDKEDDVENDNEDIQGDNNDRQENENNNNNNVTEKAPLKNAFTLLMTKAKSDGFFVKPEKGAKTDNKNSTENAKSKKFSRWNNWNNKKQNPDTVYAPKYKQIKFGQMQKPIIVDGFQYSNINLSDTYFLTHFHSDHYQGLDRHFNHGTIYCSPTTASLVRLRLKVTSTCIIPLELNKIHLIVAGGVNVKVIFLDANHCPGAVIILFLFDTGQKVIHTGDFRWNRQLLSASFLSDLAKTPTNPKNLIVYLDTTYCDPQYNFPPQDKTILSVLDCVQNEIENDDNDIKNKVTDKKTLFVFGAYGIGKERVFMSVAANLNMKVYVEPSRYKAMMCFNDWSTQEKAMLTTNPNISNIWVVPMNKINFNSLTKLKFKKGQHCKRVVAFQPTGWTFTQASNAEPALHTKTSNTESQNTAKVINSESLLVLRSNPRDNNIIYSVPYSEHSSFGEIIDFVRIFKPHKIIPTVKTSIENVQSQLDIISKFSNLQIVGIKSSNQSEF